VSESKAAPAAATDQGARNLTMRIAAAVVLAPLTIAAAYAGGWFWIVLATAAAIGLCVEWLMVIGAQHQRSVMGCGPTALAIAGVLLGFGWIEVSWLALALGFLAVVLLSRQARPWTAAGFCYAAAALMASVLVRHDAVMGFLALLFVLGVVWASDIGGYFAGRGIGGPRLWPKVSPKKTWAGAIGGFAASLVVAELFAVFDPHRGDPLLALRNGPLLALAAVLSIAAQFGDLFESAVKRRFGVKDSSRLIPGHGGLMDRLDGFIAAIVLAAIIGLLRGGADRIARGLVIW
jgi:phosphatidate cytidylyltransferase